MPRLYARLAGATAGLVVAVAGFSVAGVLTGEEPSSARAATSCELIGFQNGVVASMNRLRRLDPGGTNATRTGAWDKLERTLLILVRDHDAGCSSSSPPPPPTTTSPAPPPPPPPPPAVAPRTYNALPGGEPSARFCVQGLPRNAEGRLYDAFSTYDDDGRDLGGRTTFTVPELKPANEMDSRGPCDPYTYLGRSFPPWPAGSYQR